ncbi:LVIVD repeat-containing protein [Marinigracilibium pacificum]|uniref:Choice-of-anchor B family protein n=1 Tax=Marinigracilibium pacificum TaxID=2729599 RepID=A0A848IZ90_9BACT|nr:choice-of-anchor B family protein [Marinigracilibium pacificum]NMM47534.1 choice-of-anchor B family protein [Marinigracilibium pacificum]
MKNNLIFFSLLVLFISACTKEDVKPEDKEPPVYNHSPNELAGRLNFMNDIKDIWAFESPTQNQEYILVGYKAQNDNSFFGQGGMYVVDHSDIENPKQISSVPGVYGFDIKTYGNYAYTVSGRPSDPGYIIDLSNPKSPVVVSEFSGAHNILTTETGLLIASSPGIKIYDIATDPENPTFLWSDNKGDGHEAHVNGDYLYDFHGSLGAIIYNISDPSNPDSIGAIQTPEVRYYHSGWTNADQTVLVMCDELAFQSNPTGDDFYIYDITDKTNPVLLTSISDETSILHNVHIVGDYAYFSYYTAGYKVYDISDPANPTLAFEYDTAPTETGEVFSGAWGIYGISDSGYKYVSDSRNGLYIFKSAE